MLNGFELTWLQNWKSATGMMNGIYYILAFTAALLCNSCDSCQRFNCQPMALYQHRIVMKLDFCTFNHNKWLPCAVNDTTRVLHQSRKYFMTRSISSSFILQSRYSLYRDILMSKLRQILIVAGLRKRK
jgi:hypothetical protein